MTAARDPVDARVGIPVRGVPQVPALALIYLPLGLGFHTGIWVTMRAPFFTFMALYAAFVPWSAVYRWLCEKRPVSLRRMARIKPS